MQVTDSIRYVGVNDHQVDLFEELDGHGEGAADHVDDKLSGEGLADILKRDIRNSSLPGYK